MKLRWIASLALLTAALYAPTPVPAQTAPVVVYVVRHAERAENGTNDPPISSAGRDRARLMVPMMEGAGLTHLHTTDFQRTRMTLIPIALDTGLEPTVYDPQDLESFAAELRATPGHHLVVGHSNTNPALVEALGGEPGPQIGEMEYDRAYVVVIYPNGGVGSAIWRFGEGS